LTICEQQLRAIERSRWWRIHPRRLVGRLASVPSPASTAGGHRRPAVSPAKLAATAPTDDPSLASFAEDVMVHGTFTQDWVTSRFVHWRPVLETLEGRAAQILEIGSYEGLSTCYLLWRLPRVSITCIDTFSGIPEEAGGPSRPLESTFDANVALVDALRVTKLVGDSKRRLLDLAADDRRFDLVYVDGSHLGLDVLVDAALAWQLLVPNGVAVFDDYRWDYLGDDPLLRPREAIDAFCTVVAGKHEVVFANDQLALRRVA
jgi:predicted O-methyltransferase YrrM